MKVSVDERQGVIDGASLAERQELRILLDTFTRTVGTRMFFAPTRHSLTLLAKDMKAEFAPECRTAWAHFFTSKKALRDSFTFKTKPYAHQLETFDKTKDFDVYAYFWEMGCGKTKPILDTAAWLFTSGQIDAVLVVTLKGVHANWVTDEIPTHLGIDAYKAAYWSAHRVEGGMKGILEYRGLAVAALNYDSLVNRKGKGFKFAERFCNERRVLIVVDESHGIKNPQAARTRSMRTLGKMKRVKFKRIATGTSTPNSPLDLFSQMKFMRDDIFPDCSSMGAFKTRFARLQDLPGTVDPYRKTESGAPLPAQKVVGYKNLDELKAEIAPFCSFLTKEECLDLPPKVYRRQVFEISEEARKLYNSMKNDLIMEIDGGRVTAQLALTKLLRLHQLVCGFTVMDGTKEPIPIGKTSPRLDAFEEYSEKVRGKAIVWANYQYNLDQLEEFLRRKFGSRSTVVYRGSTSDTDRKSAITLFQGQGGPQWFLGQPQSGGTGITLTAAQDVSYYSNTQNLSLRLQSEDRAHRIGQKGTVTYTDFEALNTIERQFINSLREKRELGALISGKVLRDWLTEND